jgi:hypothetical protein
MSVLIYNPYKLSYMTHSESKCTLALSKNHVMQIQWRVKAWFYVFLSSILEGTWTALSPGCFTTEERATGIRWIRNGVGHTPNWDIMWKINPLALPENEPHLSLIRHKILCSC